MMAMHGKPGGAPLSLREIQEQELRERQQRHHQMPPPHHQVCVPMELSSMGIRLLIRVFDCSSGLPSPYDTGTNAPSSSNDE